MFCEVRAEFFFPIYKSRLFFSSWISWCFCWEAVGHVCVYFFILCFVATDFCLVVCQSYLVLITVALWYVLKFGSISSPTLFFVLKVVLATLGPLFFLMNFRISLSISIITSPRILIENWHLSNIVPLDLWVRCSSPLIRSSGSLSNIL